MSKWVLEEKNGIKYYRLDFDEPGFENIVCLFFTRIGGLRFLFEKPEIFSKDILWVKENFGIKQINILKQIHSDKIYYISEQFKSNKTLEGDGMFTDLPNEFLSVRVADCLPIYFFTENKKVIGILHSGWKGTISEIGVKLVQLLKKQFDINPNQLSFAFGPSIGQCCYEVGDAVADRFYEFTYKHNIENAVIKRHSKIYLDIKIINQALLKNLGLREIADIGLCSYCNNDIFYSARSENLAGRNLALLGYKM